MNENNISKGMKVSISHSIKKAFLKYMVEIKWDDAKYDSEQFIQFWLQHSKDNAAWMNEVSKETLEDASFQEQLNEKVNERIKKIIETEPTNEQIDQINVFVKKTGVADIDFCCKAEADYHIDKFKYN